MQVDFPLLVPLAVSVLHFTVCIFVWRLFDADQKVVPCLSVIAFWPVLFAVMCVTFVLFDILFAPNPHCPSVALCLSFPSHLTASQLLLNVTPGVSVAAAFSITNLPPLSASRCLTNAAPAGSYTLRTAGLHTRLSPPYF